MSWTRIGISVTGAATAVTVLLACSTVWLLLTAPVTIARAVDQGTILPLAGELAKALVQALRTLFAYL